MKTLALALLMLAPALCAQDKMAEALRKGVVEEDTNQNLNAAIQSYQSVVAQYDEDRKSAATALFRLAECYRKQGKNDQATAAYKRVVQEFADQNKLAEQSRTHLPKGQQTASTVSPSVTEARRQVRAILEEKIKNAEAELDRTLRFVSADDPRISRSKDQILDLRQQLAVFDLQTAQDAATTSPRR
jgi:tetratricopeptide (TPR) repeat protein